MLRFLVAHLPLFRLERAGWHAGQLAALVGEEKSDLRVQTATPPALRRGVVPGMTQAEARALVPDLVTEPSDPAGELRDLDELAAQLLRVSPNVRALPPDALVAEVSRSKQAALSGWASEPLGGTPQRVGAERALLERVRIRLDQLGHLVTVVVADDPGTALACAAWSRRCQVVPPGQGAQALAPLPLDALDLPPAERSLLQGLGIDTVGAFAALPAAAVVGRLGPVGVAAHALARGRASAVPVSPWLTPDVLALEQDLPDPVVQLEALLFILNALLRDGCSRLAAAGKAASRVRLRFGLDGASSSVQELAVRLGEPTRDPRRVLALLRLRLERFQLAGPVVSVRLELPDPAPFDGRQRDLLRGRAGGDALAVAIAHLQDTLGPAAVAVPALQDRHRPEAAWSPRAVDPEHFDRLTSSTGGLAMLVSDPPSPSRALAGDDPVAEWSGQPVRLLRESGHPATVVPLRADSSALHALVPAPADRPALLLPAPLAVDVRTPPGGLPLALHTEGRWLDVVAARGPERLEGEWWEQGFRREYWLLTLSDGRRAWVYRQDGRWALHGWWDR